MPFYQTLGQLPPKRHTQFARPAGATSPGDGPFYYEQLFGTIGFEGMSSLLYHVHRPTMVREVLDSVDMAPKLAVAKNMLSRKLLGFGVEPADDFLESRVPLLVNNDLTFGLAAPRQSLTDYFYKNADADELLFVHRGSGKLRTLFGTIPFQYGDYLIIPRGVIYQIEFDSTDCCTLNHIHPFTRPNAIEISLGNCSNIHLFVSGILFGRLASKRMTKQVIF